MDFELIINPQKEEHYPERYKAVLLLNGGLSKCYPKEMDYETILAKVSAQVNTYSDGILKLTHHE